MLDVAEQSTRLSASKAYVLRPSWHSFGAYPTNKYWRPRRNGSGDACGGHLRRCSPGTSRLWSSSTHRAGLKVGTVLYIAQVALTSPLLVECGGPPEMSLPSPTNASTDLRRDWRMQSEHICYHNAGDEADLALWRSKTVPCGLITYVLS